MKAVIFRLLKAQVRFDSLSYQGRFCKAEKAEKNNLIWLYI